MNGARECAHCGKWCGNGGGAGRHELEHTRPPAPLWCTCLNPEAVTAYGFAYCGRCLRGFEPVKALA